MNLTWRALGLEDAVAAAKLNNIVARVDGTGDLTTEDVVVEMMRAPGFDPATDTFAIWAEPDLIGFGAVHVRESLVEGRALADLSGYIHPDYRGRGLGAQLLTRLERRATDKAGQQHPGAPIRVRASGGLAHSGTQHLLELFDYAPDNYYITMEVDLRTWTDPGTPTRAVMPGPELIEAIREAHNDAFRDHRNHSPISQKQWEHLASSSTLRPRKTRVVVQDERVLAYAVAQEFQPDVIHISLVGTRRGARGRGFAKDVLISSLRSSRDGGYRISELEVDSASPTGADRLYRAVGYQPVRVVSRYYRDID